MSAFPTYGRLDWVRLQPFKASRQPQFGGLAAAVLTGENLSKLYGLPVVVMRVEGGGFGAFATWPASRSRP